VAKKKRKAAGKKKSASFWNSGAMLSDPVRTRRLALLSLVAALVVGAIFGMGRLQAHVRSLSRYDRVLALEWVDLPDWLQQPRNRHILETLTHRVDLTNDDRLLDVGLAERLGSALLDPAIGWIKAVDRVVVRPDGMVAIHCLFRRPAAWVLHEGYCYLVDAESVRLPGRYEPEGLETNSLLTIHGVAASPPGVGMQWPGTDLTSGIRLASLISDHPFTHQVDRIIVANHDGRQDRARPHLEIATDRPGSRIWWGRPPAEEFGTEISASQKLALLDKLYARWGRIDLNRAYVDIRTHPDSVVLPNPSSRSH